MDDCENVGGLEEFQTLEDPWRAKVSLLAVTKARPAKLVNSGFFKEHVGQRRPSPGVLKRVGAESLACAGHPGQERA